MFLREREIFGKSLGITDGLVRVAVGLETLADIEADLARRVTVGQVGLPLRYDATAKVGDAGCYVAFGRCLNIKVEDISTRVREDGNTGFRHVGTGLL